MEQIKAFIEKAKTDSELMAKLDTLGAKGEETNAVIALAAEYGFTFTAQDYEQAGNCGGNCTRCGELSEEELDAVSGGASANRYDPNVCPKLTRARYECVGFLRAFYCDHFKFSDTGRKTKSGLATFNHVCAMGAFSYEGNSDGYPV